MKRVLVIYANTDTVMRVSVSLLLYCFEKYLTDCEVYYHNAIFNRAPILSLYRKVDYVIFHHSVTTVWNRPRYTKKICSWSSCDFGDAKKIALMQDEYKNVDLLRKFINEVMIDSVFTLSPPSQWVSLYGQDAVDKAILKQYLAGYIEIPSDQSHRSKQRDIDIGYRADWNKMHVKLGKTGLLKRDIAFEVSKLSLNLNITTDIKIGSEYFIKGHAWSFFLSRCRYVIGVPSGSSVLDKYGEIEASLIQKLNINPDTDREILYNELVSNQEDSLVLEVLSPRHLEAMVNGCGQILIESDYNGLLKPWRHYLPLKRDFSNLEEILRLVSDEPLRLEMVRNCQNEIVNSEFLNYKTFAHSVIPNDNLDIVNSNKSILKHANVFVEVVKDKLIYFRNKFYR